MIDDFIFSLPVGGIGTTIPFGVRVPPSDNQEEELPSDEPPSDEEVEPAASMAGTVIKRSLRLCSEAPDFEIYPPSLLAESDGRRSRLTPNPLIPYVTSTSKSRGLALIINNYEFPGESGLSRRACGPSDGEKLKATFKKCRYRIRNEVNKTAEEIRSIFDQLLPLTTPPADRGTTDGIVQESDDSFVCCIVSHGHWDEGKRQDFVYGSDGQSVSIQQLALDYLNVPPDSNRQNLLKQKPKLFFIHACRGKEITVVSADDDQSGGQPLPPLPQVNLFPISADFLFSYPVVPGTKAFRDDHSGTFFVTFLCRMIEDLREKLDVVPIVKRVHYELTSEPSTAYNYVNEQGKTVAVRHCPQIISTLRGPFFLSIKAENKYRKNIGY